MVEGSGTAVNSAATMFGRLVEEVKLGVAVPVLLIDWYPVP
jgi:hypothetical protein